MADTPLPLPPGFAQTARTPPPPTKGNPASSSSWQSILLGAVGALVFIGVLALGLPKPGPGPETQKATAAMLAQVRSLQTELEGLRQQMTSSSARCQTAIGDLVAAIVSGQQPKLPSPPVTLQAKANE